MVVFDLANICENCESSITDAVLKYSLKIFNGLVFCRDYQSKYPSSKPQRSSRPTAKNKQCHASSECEDCVYL